MVAPAAMGQFGGKVLRTITDGTEVLPPGTELSAERIAGWPIRNRKSLRSSGKIEFYNIAPAASAEPARRGRPSKSIDALFQ